MLQTWMKLTWVDFKLFFRSFIVVFFTFAFPVLNVVLFGVIYGNDPSPIFGGMGSVDVMIPGYIAALVIGSIGFMNLPIEIATRRQMGILRRLRTSPLHPLAVIGAQIGIQVFVAVLSAVLLIVTGKIVFDAVVPTFSWVLAAAFLLSCMSLFAFTIMLSNFFRNIDAVRAVFMALFFPMMFISGGTLPLEFMPETVQTVSKFLPLTYIVTLIKDAYFDQQFQVTALVVLSIMLVVCTVVAVLTFRWE